MKDESFYGGDKSGAVSPYTPFDDPSVQVEPLAVPLGNIASIVRRHIRVLIFVFLAGVCATFLFLESTPRQYTAEASILLEPQRTQVSDLQAISADPGDIGTVVRTQIDILKSPTLAAGVVRALRLYENPEFTPSSGLLRGKFKELLRWVGLDPALRVRAPDFEDQIDAAGTILSNKISFTNEVHSGVLHVAVATGDPVLSANVVNELAREFLDFKRQAKFAAMQRAHDWFRDQMGSLSNELRDDDQAVQRYRLDHKLAEYAPTSGDVPTPTANRLELETVSRELSDVSKDRARKEGELEQVQLALRGQLSPASLPAVLSSPIITSLLAQAATVAGQQAHLASHFGDHYPDLVAVRAQLGSLQRRITEVMNNITRSISADLGALKWQEAYLQKRVEQLRANVGEENSAMLGLRSLEVKARATRGIYESFLTRATQLANVAGIQEQDASLVSSARPPIGPSAPQPARILVVGAGLSFVLGIALICLIERLRSGFSMPEQLEAAAPLPVIGLVPWIPQRQRRRGKRPAALFEASFEKLRGQIRLMSEGRPQCIMVTSALSREGKSTIAAGLARSASSAGWRVLLIDCDFRCPSLAQEFGLAQEAGIRDILQGGVLSGDVSALIREVEPGLCVLSAGIGGQGHPQELLASNRMNELLTSYREDYDLVILDTPPILPVADAHFLAKQVDATLMVVKWETTPRSAFLSAMRILHSCHAKIVGTVLTCIDVSTAANSSSRMAYAVRYYDGYPGQK